MTRTTLAIFLLSLVACSSQSEVARDDQKLAGSQSNTETDGVTVVDNVRVYGSVDAETIVMQHGRIVAVGSKESVARYRAHGNVIDGKGAMALPGFHDAHVHLMGGGLSLARAQIKEVPTLDETLARIKAWADANPNAPWVLGRGWNYNIVKKGEFPTAKMLDTVVSDRPAMMRAYDGHSAWVNSKALALLKLTKDSKDPAGGKIVRDVDGNPTGALLENAQDLLEGVVPDPNRDEMKAALLAGVQHLTTLGITEIDAIEYKNVELEILHELERENKLTMRIRYFPPLETPVDELKAMVATNTPMVSVVGVKGFVDGVIESKTAYMLLPYEGEKTAHGEPQIPRDTLFSLVEAADGIGLQVLLHAIGDAGVRMSLDAFENAHKKHPDVLRRHRIEHIEVVSLDDVKRFATPFAMASMQPYHALPYPPDADKGAWSENIGEERRRRSFAWRLMLDAKAGLCFGSDWPIYTADPLRGMGVATTRKNEKGFPPNGWNAQLTVTPTEAINAYTTERGYADGPATDVGTLQSGQRADLVLVDGLDLKDPMTFFTAKVTHTIFNGAIVYRAP